MKAFVRIDADNQEVRLEDIPLPKIKPDEVLIKVAAFGVGIHDRYFIPQGVEFPYTIGSEGSGVITELGSNASDFSIGERVIFTTILQPQGGSWAEYAVAKQTSLIPLPNQLTFVQGATISIAGKTALECLRAINLKEDDQLFIAGASGAIGTFLIQLAKAKGIRISASASEKNLVYMKSLGAEQTVDYHDIEWKSKVTAWSNGGVDVAIAIQPGTGTGSIKVVKNGGKLITVSGDNAMVQDERNIIITQMQHHNDTQEKLVELVNAIADEEILVIIDTEYSFEQALQALEKTETRHARGKIIVKI